MSQLSEKEWKSVYRTGEDNLLADFYMPALSCATQYDRAVGYFSSELLIFASQGLSNLIRANGKMRLIIGHPLDEDEYIAVKEGNAISWAFDELHGKISSLIHGVEGEVGKHRLKLLTWLLACGLLEIKFAFRKRGMYHEKIGIVTDEQGSKLVFTGSANETLYAMDMASNAESVSVFPSWKKDVFESYGLPYELGFDALWSGQQRDTYTVGLPSTLYESLAKLGAADGRPNLDLEDLLDRQRVLEESPIFLENFPPFVPKTLGGKVFQIKDHQSLALNKWKASDYQGILKLATGSGKTITAIYGAVKIFEAFGKLVLIVAVPYNELARQWVDNLKTFGISPNKCYDSKDQWYDNFKLDIQAFVADHKKFLAAVVINKTLRTQHFQDLLAQLPTKELLFVGDECHRHGAQNTNRCLPAAAMRMGLSATPFRSEDDELDSPFPDDAKKRLIDYYGDVVAEYSLSDAINDDVLTPYEYHVCGVRLTQEEQEEYEDLSRRIGNLISSDNSSKKKQLTILCGQRSRLLGSAANKLIALKTLLAKLGEEFRGHALFYCAEGSSETNMEYGKNIDKVSMLLNEFGWRTSQFTSLENSKIRKSILGSFLSGGIDALVSMKVLDEGIDIPACKSAFILASTKNPRQYVQRRGRILRKHQGKKFAVIFDFVVLPAKGSEGSSSSKNLVKAEMERVNDFVLLAKNQREIHRELEQIGVG